MLEQVFRRSRVVARYRHNTLSKHLDDFAGFLLSRGHSLTTVHCNMQAVEHFGVCLGRRRGKIILVDGDNVAAFLHKHLPVAGVLS